MSIDPLPCVPDGDPDSAVALVRAGGAAGRVVLHLSTDLRDRLTAGAADGLAARLQQAPPGRDRTR
ncbi:hypothetical protein [Catenuloplanes indicus]|uniref:Uncharacterized protein n=1 Tax=Catenuloplanes indicus TaxID=137267 RepID=A0AAE3VYD4_9ACTN|nr:hypothetical protein [Catenuloplanes indicus]MDQ0365245.1 hypothetical protein [Catenuloplanes indicus]